MQAGLFFDRPCHSLRRLRPQSEGRGEVGGGKTMSYASSPDVRSFLLQVGEEICDAGFNGGDSGGGKEEGEKKVVVVMIKMM